MGSEEWKMRSATFDRRFRRDQEMPQSIANLQKSHSALRLDTKESYHLHPGHVNVVQHTKLFILCRGASLSPRIMPLFGVEAFNVIVSTKPNVIVSAFVVRLG